MLAFVTFSWFLNFGVFKGDLNLGFAVSASKKGCFHFWIYLRTSNNNASEAYQSIDFFGS